MERLYLYTEEVTLPFLTPVLIKLCARGVASSLVGDSFPLCKSAVLARDGFADQPLPGQPPQLCPVTQLDVPFSPLISVPTPDSAGREVVSHLTSSPAASLPHLAGG